MLFGSFFAKKGKTRIFLTLTNLSRALPFLVMQWDIAEHKKSLHLKLYHEYELLVQKEQCNEILSTNGLFSLLLTT